MHTYPCRGPVGPRAMLRSILRSLWKRDRLPDWKISKNIPTCAEPFYLRRAHNNCLWTDSIIRWFFIVRGDHLSGGSTSVITFPRLVESELDATGIWVWLRLKPINLRPKVNIRFNVHLLLRGFIHFLLRGATPKDGSLAKQIITLKQLWPRVAPFCRNIQQLQINHADLPLMSLLRRKCQKDLSWINLTNFK